MIKTTNQIMVVALFVSFFQLHVGYQKGCLLSPLGATQKGKICPQWSLQGGDSPVICDSLQT